MTDKLPEINGWQIKRIQDISDVTGGSTPSTNEPAYWEGDIPFVTPTDITSLKNSNYIEKTRRYITEKGLHAISSDLLEPGTILLTSRATLGEVAINKVPLVTNQGFANFKPHSDINGLWLLHYLRAQKRELERLSSGSTFKEISKKSIKRMKIPVPPLVEQRGIVEVLGTVDECIRLTDAVIERAEELKRGLMQHLLTRGIGHTEYKETSLGKIPKTWKIKRLGEISKLFKHSESEINSEIYVGIENLESKTGRISNFENQNDYTTKQIFKQNTILFGRIRSYLNKKWLANKDGYCSTDIIVIDPQKTHGKFLLYHLLSKEFVNYSIRFSYGSQMPRIHWKDIRNYSIPYPPLDEQNEIVKIIENLDKKIEIHIDNKNKLKLVKQGLMQQLLSGNIRVELREDGLHRIGDSREANN